MPSPTSFPGSLLRLARPHHWVKNAFVVLPIPFAIATDHAVDFMAVALGLAGFSLVASAVYVFNDLRDAGADRRSPRKRSRPIASGAVSHRAAALFGAALLLGGALLCAATRNLAALSLVALYLAANLAYSLHLKHVTLVDVFLLASGYVIRVLLGCALAGVPASAWLLACTSALALFLAFAKRRSDLVDGVSLEHRPALAGYTVGFLDQALGTTCAVTLVTYALYSIEAGVFLPGRELAGMPFVAFALLYYLSLAYREGEGASPVALALRSLPLQACALAWSAATAWSLGLV
jgi:4-hydroxybenzoate polyprenyltransferase